MSVDDLSKSSSEDSIECDSELTADPFLENEMETSNWKIIEIKPISDDIKSDMTALPRDADPFTSKILDTTPTDMIESQPSYYGDVSQVKCEELQSLGMIITVSENCKVEEAEVNEVGLDYGDDTLNLEAKQEHEFSPINSDDAESENYSMVIPRTETWEVKQEETCSCCVKEENQIDTRECTKQMNVPGSVASPETYPCLQCERTFTSLCNLGKHMIDAHSAPRSMNEACDICGQTFRYQTCLIKHKKKHATAVSENSLLEINQTVREGEGNMEKLSKCPICGYETRAQLEHIKTHYHNIFPCNECKKTFYSKTRLTWHQNVAHRPQVEYTCGICGLVYEKQSLLAQHVIMHKREQMLIVEQEQIKQMRQTKKREAKMLQQCLTEDDRSTTSFIFRCSYCEKLYQTLIDVSLHIKVAHPNDNLSHVLDHAYSSKNSTHIKGYHPHDCPNTTIHLIDHAYSVAHERKHANNLTRKQNKSDTLPFSNQLPYRTLSKKSVKKPSPVPARPGTSTRYKANSNSAKSIIQLPASSANSFVTPVQLAQKDDQLNSFTPAKKPKTSTEADIQPGTPQHHLYNAERPYVCHVCYKGFKRQDHLTQHIKTHFQKLPYICSDCGKGFRDREKLEKHTKEWREATGL